MDNRTRGDRRKRHNSVQRFPQHGGGVYALGGGDAAGLPGHLGNPVSIAPAGVLQRILPALFICCVIYLVSS
jgi:hypothetical protein